MIDLNAPENYICMCPDFQEGVERMWRVEYPSGRAFTTPARCEHEALQMGHVDALGCSAVMGAKSDKLGLSGYRPNYMIRAL